MASFGPCLGLVHSPVPRLNHWPRGLYMLLLLLQDPAAWPSHSVAACRPVSGTPQLAARLRGLEGQAQALPTRVR